MPDKKKKRWAENLTFWTALLTFLTTITDKVFEYIMPTKDHAEPTHVYVEPFTEESIDIVVNSEAPVSSFSWSSMLMIIAMIIFVLILVIKIRRRRAVRQEG